MKTWRRAGGDVVLLDYSSVRKYAAVAVDDKLTRLPLPQQADYIRICILNQNAGIWMDTDTLVLGPPKHALGLLEENEVVLAGKPQIPTAFLNFVASSRPGTSFMGTLQEEMEALVRTPQLPEDLPWDYVGGPYYRRVKAGVDEGSKVAIFDAVEHRFFQEAVHGKGLGRKNYLNFWFRNELDFHPQLVADASVVLLHNSWTPKRYKALVANKDVWIRGEMLSAYLRYALVRTAALRASFTGAAKASGRVQRMVRR